MSRLRRPTSASTSTTVAPVAPSAAPVFAVVVVLPTPPFPLVTTIARPRLRGTALVAGASCCSISCIAIRQLLFAARSAARTAWGSRYANPLARLSEDAREEPGCAEGGERYQFALEPARDLVVDRRQTRLGLQHDRLALVGRVDHLFVVGDDAEQLGRKDVGDVVDREHVAAAHHLRAQTVHDQAQRKPAFLQLADHAVG